MEFRRALAGVMACVFLAGSAYAQEIMDYIKQDGLIVDDTPLGFQSAKEAAEKIPQNPDFVLSSSPQIEAAGIRQYSRKAERWTSWWVFGPTSGFYPALVRRRVVNLDKYAEVRTTILCSASKQACDEIRARFDTMDHVCGAALPACKHQLQGHTVSPTAAASPASRSSATASAASATEPASLIHEGLAQPPSPSNPDRPVLAFGYADNPYVIPWPRDANGQLLTGKIVLLILVSKDGLPAHIDISSSSGHRALDIAAVEGSKRFRFHPALRDGSPVEGYVRFPLDMER